MIFVSLLLANCSPMSMIPIPKHCTELCGDGSLWVLRALVRFKGQHWKDMKKHSHHMGRDHLISHQPVADTSISTNDKQLNIKSTFTAPCVILQTVHKSDHCE